MASWRACEIKSQLALFALKDKIREINHIFYYIIRHEMSEARMESEIDRIARSIELIGRS